MANNNQITLNNIKTIFHNIAVNLSFLNDYFFGDAENLGDNRKYPLLFVFHESSDYDNNELILYLNVMVLDKLMNDYSNQTEIYSDTLQVLGDIKSYLERSQEFKFKVNKRATIEKVFSNINSDFVCGNMMKLEIRVPFSANICTIAGIVLSGTTHGGEFPYMTPSYLTCETLASCPSFIANLGAKADLTGATFSGNIFAPSVSATTFYGDGSNLSGISTDNYFTTGATLIGSVLYFNRNDLLSAYTANLSGLATGFSGWTAGTGFQSIIAANSGNATSGNFTIVGGSGSTANGNHSVILAGRNNTANYDLTAIVGGRSNTAQGHLGFIGGGRYNRTGYMATVAGGNTNYSTGNESVVAGGRNNLASSQFSTVAGGVGNIANYSTATVVGGNTNRASGSASVAGGLRNAATGHYSIAMGFQNSATTNYSVAIGGNTNRATAIGAIVIGGTGINGSNVNTVHVPHLNIQSATTDATVNSVLVRNSDGQVYIRDTSTIGTTGNFLPLSGGTVTGNTQFVLELSAKTFVRDIYQFTASTSANTYNIDFSNGNYQILTFNTGTTLTYSNAKIGLSNVVVNATGTTAISLSGSSGWYTPAGIQLGFDNTFTLMQCVYDGTRMIVSTYENLNEIL